MIDKKDIRMRIRDNNKEQISINSKEVIPTSITSQIIKEGIRIGQNNQINKIFKEVISKITTIIGITIIKGIKDKINYRKEESTLKGIITKM